MSLSNKFKKLKKEETEEIETIEIPTLKARKTPEKVSIEKFEKEKTVPKTTVKDTKSEINKSVELNNLKAMYANRFMTTTNMRKADMQEALIKKWIEENNELLKTLKGEK